MSKIIQVINAMISNPNKISDVRFAENGEIFFMYNKKHKWSIVEDINAGIVRLYLYPKNDLSYDDLIKYSAQSDIVYVTYISSDFKSQEATESFQELMQLIKDKVFGVNDIFNDILSEDLL